MNTYKHTQVGYVLIVALGAAVVMIGNLAVATKFNPGVFLPLALMILCLLAFATLTVQVNDQAITLRFGIGLIRRSFLLQDVQAYRPVKNPWYYAWGIHAIPGGWIFNVSGWEAIELEMKNGKKYRIGTDDVQGLANAVESHVQNMKP
jgi:cytochrome c biogenesis factor